MHLKKIEVHLLFSAFHPGAYNNISLIDQLSFLYLKMEDYDKFQLLFRKVVTTHKAVKRQSCIYKITVR